MLPFRSAKIRWNSWCRNVCVANFHTLSTQVNPEVTNLFEASTSTPLYIHTFEDLKALKRLQEQPSHREDTSHQNISPLIESNLGERKKRAAGWCQWEQTREAAEVKHRDGSERQIELSLRWEITGRWNVHSCQRAAAVLCSELHRGRKGDPKKDKTKAVI